MTNLIRKNLLALWTIIILVVVLIPGDFVPETEAFFNWKISPDKVVHFFLFAPFSFLLSSSLFYNKNINNVMAILYTIVVSLVFAFTTETLQFYLPIGRNGNFLDFVADAIGCFIGILLFHLRKHTKN